MAEPITSVRAALAFGERLDILLLLWQGMSSKLREVMGEMLSISLLCTTTLRDLQEILTEDEIASPHGDRIFTLAGLDDIESLATKCNLVYRAVVLLIQKAAEIQNSQSATDRDGQDLPEDRKTDYKTEFLMRPVPDLSSTKTVGLISKLRNQRLGGWLYKRLLFCADQLFWVQHGLLMHLQIAKHARMYV